MRTRLLTALGLVAISAPGASVPIAETAELEHFFGEYCIGCHGPDKQKGERRLDQWSWPISDQDTLLAVQEVIDVLTLEDMPPEDAKAHPPTAAVQEMIDHLTGLAFDGHAHLASTGGEVVLRRLNREEYLNTVGDLFGINMIMFDPTTAFPQDQTVEHLDNIGDTLRTSGYLLSQYLEAAEAVVEKALRDEPPPPEQTWRFTDNFYQQPELRYSHTKVHDNQFIGLYEGIHSIRHEGGYGPITEFAEGVPADGYYEIKVKAEALNREHPYDQKNFRSDPTQPFRLGIRPGRADIGPLHEPQPIEPQLGELVLSDGPADWYTFRVWLDQGFTPRFTFPNGALSIRNTYGRVLRDYNDQFPEELRDTKGIVEYRVVVMRHGFLPHIRIHDVEINGPLDAEWPSQSQQLIYGNDSFDREGLRSILTRFATRAYRRPATKEDVDRLMHVVDARRNAGHSAKQALKDGLKAALCSPAFLYMIEPVEADADTRELDAYALVNRLSYFLWATMPDEALLAKAADRSILDPTVMVAETRRMLADPRAERLVTRFTDAWLNLRSLGDMAPDRDMFPEFYAEDLQTAMKQETRQFTQDLLDRNESVIRFIDADYTFANRSLARLYGVEDAVPPSQAHTFQRINLPDRNRGGLLGHASVLTVTANGIETSPVTRGVWVLENILGAPPPPPPDDVPAIDPDVRGASSISEILAKHRDTPACYDCHLRIDPPGFALEHFDPIGRWRDRYPNKLDIELAADIPAEDRYADAAALRERLLERKEQFAHMLVERLMMFACGRRMEALDRPALDGILANTKPDAYRFRDLIEQIVVSEPFRNN
ncbi:DUF1592 domain-containing protein [Opitutaceae bacterium]|nr:DUF1592 domain-containing protein [Opitutaceae bacterium]